MRSGLVIELTTSGLRLHGDCDLCTARRLDGALRRLERRRTPWEVDLARLGFVDSHGLEPIAESVRRCRQLRWPEPVLRPGPAVRRVLTALQVAAEPFDLQAWDRVGQYAGPVVPSWRSALSG